MISIAKRKPFIFEVRDIWPDEAIELRILKNKILIQMSYWLEEFLYQHSDFLVVNSPGIKEFLIKKKLVPETKIAVVPNPVDLDSFDAAPTKEIAKKNFGWPEDKFIFLYSGAMSAVYDLNSLLEVTKELQHLPILFILAGSGRQKRELMEKAEAEELKNVKFAEQVPKEKLPSLIMAADAGVATLSKMPLLRYVYATKIFDYMAAGRPVVLAMEGVSKELICEKAHCGLCVKPEDKTALKKAILQIYNNPEKGEEMGKRGFEYVRKHFRPEKLACDYLRLIKLLIQTSSRTRERG